MSDHSSAEEWRAIPGFPGYEASSIGRVRTWKIQGKSRGSARLAESPRILTQKQTRTGYLEVSMSDGRKQRAVLAHKAVLLAFVGPCPEGMECRHFPDFTRTNNHTSNISWAPKTVNLAERVIRVGERNPRSKLTDDDIRQIVANRGFVFQHSLAEVFNVSQGHVANLFGRDRGRCHGITGPIDDEQIASRSA